MEWERINTSSSLSFNFKNKNGNKHSLFYCISISFFCFFFSFCALFSFISSTTTTSCLDMIRCPLSGKAADLNHFQELEKMSRDHYHKDISMARRFLSGPGSSPPRCASKCGNCTPCKPVHVPVPPGTPVTAEYYPEAWRCKCGNKLYMP